MQFITKEDTSCIAIGTTLLGSGGGGDPAQDLLLTQYYTELYGPARLIQLDELDDDALIVPVGFMGAPQVSCEMLTNGEEFDLIFEKIESYFRKPVAAVVATEIGGSNGLVPIAVASRKSIPVIDGDTLGRAFPELHMSSCSLFQISCSPCFIADSLGNVHVLHAQDAHDMEKKGRAECVKMGSSAAVSLYIMTAKQAKQALITKTVSQAKVLGQLVQEKAKEGLSSEHGLKFCYTGMITDIESRNERGFLEGKITIEGALGSIEVLFQNEYLFVRSVSGTLCSTPDIICLFEEEHFTPLCIEKLRYGMYVDVATLPSPALWKTEAGLDLVGPKAFGYDV